jgi:hypothetical protein
MVDNQTRLGLPALPTPLDETLPDRKVRAVVLPRADGIGFTVKINLTQEDRLMVGVHYRLYIEAGDNSTCDVPPKRLFQLADNPADLLLSKKFKGCVQIGVTPFTTTKTGSEYFSSIMAIDGHTSN